VVKGLLEDLVDHGLNLRRRYLVVIDGSKALRAGVVRIFGEQVEVQRCQIRRPRYDINRRLDSDAGNLTGYATNRELSISS